MSGNFQVAGGLGDHLLYVNETPDQNGHNWIFYFDNNKAGFRFDHSSAVCYWLDLIGRERPLVSINLKTSLEILEILVRWDSTTR